MFNKTLVLLNNKHKKKFNLKKKKNELQKHN